GRARRADHDEFFQRSQRDALEPGHQIGMYNADFRLDIRDDLLEQLAAIGDVNGDEARAEQIGAEPDPNDVRTVRKEGHDPVTLPHAESVEAGSSTAGLFVSLCIGPALQAEEMDEVAMHELVCSRLQHFSQDGTRGWLSHRRMNSLP